MTYIEQKVGNGKKNLEISNTVRFLFLLAGALIVLYLFLDVLAQMLPPYYSPISNAESGLAVGPYGYIMTLNFVNRGILSLVFLAGIASLFSKYTAEWKIMLPGMYLIGIWSIGALLLAAFPTDVPPIPVSFHGMIHLVVALVAFFCGGTGTHFITKGLRMYVFPRGVRIVEKPSLF